MSSRHLRCVACRIRMCANAPAISLLEGRCPICGATLRPASSVNVVGFRSFDLDVLSEQESVDAPNAPLGILADFVARREAASARVDADRWSDDGGGVKRACPPIT